MKERLVIFGIGEIAQLAHHYFKVDSRYEVVAFTAEASYLSVSEYCGLPTVCFEDLPEAYAPEAYKLFVAMSYSRVNQDRRRIFLAAKKLGYRLASYISSAAQVRNDGSIGENCFILEHNTIQPFARIGNNVTLWSGNHIGHHSIIHDHCFLASHVVVSGGVEIGESCFIGVNATIRDHIKIGHDCIIGAGALLLNDAKPGGVYACEETRRAIVPSNRLRNI